MKKHACQNQKTKEQFPPSLPSSVLHDHRRFATSEYPRIFSTLFPIGEGGKSVSIRNPCATKRWNGWITDLAHNRDDLRQVKRAQDLTHRPSTNSFLDHASKSPKPACPHARSTLTLTTRPPRIYVPRYLAATVARYRAPQIKFVDSIRLGSPIRSIMMLVVGTTGNGIQRFPNRWTFAWLPKQTVLSFFFFNRYIVCIIGCLWIRKFRISELNDDGGTFETFDHSRHINEGSVSVRDNFESFD